MNQDPSANRLNSLVPGVGRTGVSGDRDQLGASTNCRGWLCRLKGWVHFVNFFREAFSPEQIRLTPELPGGKPRIVLLARQ